MDAVDVADDIFENLADVRQADIGCLRGGECLGTFQTLVNPGAAIPPAITVRLPVIGSR